MRRVRHEEHQDHEKWAIPYADLMTLLLAFFVVMYSLSSINEAKYRVLAESINEAFNGTGKVVEPITPANPARQVPLPDKARAANATPIARIRVPVAPRHLPLPGHEGAASKPSEGVDVQMASLKAIADDVAKALQPWVESHQVVMRQTKLWLEIEIRTDVLFPSGVARLATPARTVLDDVAGVLARFPNPIRVEGYTDNLPISTWKFPSNWELSAARAGSVARLFRKNGVDPGRIGIFGWGEYHPVASNATPEGRNRNRRIAIVVLSDHGMPRRYYSNSGQPAVASAEPTDAPPTHAPPPAAPSTDTPTPVAPGIARQATVAVNAADTAPESADESLHSPP